MPGRLPVEAAQLRIFTEGEGALRLDVAHQRSDLAVREIEPQEARHLPEPRFGLREEALVANLVDAIGCERRGEAKARGHVFGPQLEGLFVGQATAGADRVVEARPPA